jgi:hypothetical protein
LSAQGQIRDFCRSSIGNRRKKEGQGKELFHRRSPLDLSGLEHTQNREIKGHV